MAETPGASSRQNSTRLATAGYAATRADPALPDSARSSLPRRPGPRALPLPEQVLLFVPNLIGYSRIALTLASVYLALDNWQLSMYCYLASFILDFFDGLAARQLNQCELLRPPARMRPTPAPQRGRASAWPLC